MLSTQSRNIARSLGIRRLGSLAAVLVAMIFAGSFVGLHAQGSRKDDVVFNAQGRPMAGATVRVCTAGATGQPCTPLANIYSDPALTQALANPTTTDGLGNYNFYAAPGRYEIEISGPNITTKQLPNIILPNDPSNPTFATLSTTSGISAFSLTLGGNLTVSGSAAVTGTLTVGGAPVPSTAQANTWTASQTFQGPTPWTDVAAFGARALAVNLGYTTTCTVSATSTSLTCAAASHFQNGDGLSLYGAGATNTLSTPGAPTVAPSLAAHATGTGLDANAPSGSTSFSYKVVALGTWSATPATNLWGAYTAASAAGSTSTGNALGSQTQTISTLSELNGALTITCSANCPMSVGAQVSVVGTSNDGFFAGQYIVASVTNSTTFVVTTGNSTPSTLNATGGTLGWFVCNHITWSAVSGAFEYAIYGRTSGSWTLLGFSWPGVTWFDDFGSTMTANLTSYGWLPTSAPASAQNGVLTTTITAGGGTTSLTVANAATGAVTSGFATFDDAPLFVAAASYADSHGGPLFIPCTPATAAMRFVIGSYLQLAGGFPMNVQQCGALALDAPFEWDAGLNWSGVFSGNNGGAAAVALTADADIDVGTAYPGIYSPNATSMFVEHTIINQSPGGNMALLTDLQNGGPGIVWQNSTWQTGGPNDYMGIHLLLGPNGSGQADNTFTNDSWIAGPNQAPNLTTTPTVILESTPQVHVDNCTVNRRGWAEIGSTGGSNTLSLHLTKGCWVQGPITPFIMTNAAGAGIGGIHLEGVLQDSSGQPILANWSPFVLNGTVEIVNANLDAPYQLVTGSGVANLVVSHYDGFLSLGGATLGQNQNYTILSSAGTIESASGTAGTLGGVTEQSRPNYQAAPNPQNFFIEELPAAPSSSASAGGTLTGTHFYGVVAHFPNGTSRSGPGGNNVTLSGGNGTIVSTWAAVPGAVKYDVWDLSRGLPTACVALTSLTCTDTGGVLTQASGTPNVPSSGYPSMGPTGMYTPQITVGGDAQFSASPRPTTTVFLPGALTSTWTGAGWTLDKAITITRVQVQAKTPPSACATNAVVRVTDGTTAVNVTVSAAANDSGAITQNYGTAAALTIAVQTAASGCGTSPADANVLIQYRMQ